MKNQYRGGGYCLKRRTWTVCRFKGGLGKKEGGFFEGGVDTPMHTIIILLLWLSTLFFL